MIGNLVVAGFARALIRIGLEKLKVDPALALGTFRDHHDVFGFFAFLNRLASVMCWAARRRSDMIDLDVTGPK